MKRDTAKGDDAIVGKALAEVLLKTDKYWFQQPHLLKLNLVLLVPMLSASVFGYDGTFLLLKLASVNSPKSTEHLVANVRASFPHERPAISSPMERPFRKSDRRPPRYCYCLSIDRLILALPVVGDFCDRFGRKPILLTGIIIICVASAIQAASVNLAMFMVCRLLIGFGGMSSSQPSPMLIAELAYPTQRGHIGRCSTWVSNKFLYAITVSRDMQGN